MIIINNYSIMLSDSIIFSGLKLNKIAEEVEKITGSRPSKEYLSKLQNGKSPPGSNKLNDAIAQVLGIDPLQFKVAAYRERIPQDVLTRLQDKNDQHIA